MRVIALLLIAGLVGCVSSPPEPTRFLLRAEPRIELTPNSTVPVVGWPRVTLAPYLNRAGLIVEITEHQVREARYHIWAEPLEQGIWHYVGTQLGNELGYPLNRNMAQKTSWERQISLRVDKFHGSLDGRSQLVASWSVTNFSNQGKVTQYSFSQTRDQDSGGYGGLVDAQIKLLDQLARAIAASLQ